jgi:hypothetical protein
MLSFPAFCSNPDLQTKIVFFSVTRTGQELFRNFASSVKKFCFMLPACHEKIFLKDSLLTMLFLQSHWGVLDELGPHFRAMPVFPAYRICIPKCL